MLFTLFKYKKDDQRLMVLSGTMVSDNMIWPRPLPTPAATMLIATQSPDAPLLLSTGVTPLSFTESRQSHAALFNKDTIDALKEKGDYADFSALPVDEFISMLEDLHPGCYECWLNEVRQPAMLSKELSSEIDAIRKLPGVEFAQKAMMITRLMKENNLHPSDEQIAGMSLHGSAGFDRQPPTLKETLADADLVPLNFAYSLSEYVFQRGTVEAFEDAVNALFRRARVERDSGNGRDLVMTLSALSHHMEHRDQKPQAVSYFDRLLDTCKRISSEVEALSTTPLSALWGDEQRAKAQIGAISFLIQQKNTSSDEITHHQKELITTLDAYTKQGAPGQLAAVLQCLKVISEMDGKHVENLYKVARYELPTPDKGFSLYFAFTSYQQGPTVRHLFFSKEERLAYLEKEVAPPEKGQTLLQVSEEPINAPCVNLSLYSDDPFTTVHFQNAVRAGEIHKYGRPNAIYTTPDKLEIAKEYVRYALVGTPYEAPKTEKKDEPLVAESSLKRR